MSEELDRYRNRLFGLIKRALVLDDHHKTYEGEIVIRYPDFFSSEAGPTMELRCYVLGGARHYVYNAMTLDGCVRKACDDLGEWEGEIEQLERDQKLATPPGGKE